MFYMFAVWLFSCRGVDSAVLHRGLFHVVVPFLMNIWTSQSSWKHRKQVHVDGAWSSPVSRKTSNCFIECQKAYNICLIPSAGACVSFEVSPLLLLLTVSLRQLHTHRHHPADLLAHSSNWVNNITLIRISEYVYMQNKKLTFHVSKKSQITRSLTGQIPRHPLSLRSERILLLPPRWTGLKQK